MQGEAAGELIEAVLPISNSPEAASRDDVNRVESTTTAVPAQATLKVGELRLTLGRTRFCFRVLNAPGSDFQFNGFTLKRTSQ